MANPSVGESRPLGLGIGAWLIILAVLFVIFAAVAVYLS
jgi:hypothetical protein